MDLHALVRKLRWSYTKNRPEFLALTRRLYPEFVFAYRPREIADEIPVFNFHDVTSEDFEEKIKYLHGNGYQCLDSHSLWKCLTSAQKIHPKSVVLTFDDGWLSLHTVAAPLLRKYQMNAVCFLIPGLMSQSREIPPAYPGAECLLTWEEARLDRDVIDFQSHSMWHHRVFISPKLVDFIHPGYDSYYLRFHVPVYRNQGRDTVERIAALGPPVYEYAPRLTGRLRYFDDEAVREACAAYVKENGQEAFFTNPAWRRKLRRIFDDASLHSSTEKKYESADETRESILADLRESRSMIERELPGVEVRSFCYPWFVGCDLSVTLSQKAGYTSNHWGVLSGRRTNRDGYDPFRIVRMPPDYIMRLPGKGRWTFIGVLKNMFFRNAHRFMRDAKAAAAPEDYINK